MARYQLQLCERSLFSLWWQVNRRSEESCGAREGLVLGPDGDLQRRALHGVTLSTRTSDQSSPSSRLLPNGYVLGIIIGASMVAFPDVSLLALVLSRTSHVLQLSPMDRAEQSPGPERLVLVQTRKTWMD